MFEASVVGAVILFGALVALQMLIV